MSDPSDSLMEETAETTGLPVAKLIRAEVMGADRLHADDTPIRVLDPKMKLAGRERGVKEGRVWVYVRDDRPWTGLDPPAAAYWFSPDLKGEHPQTHLKNFMGILQADAYSGFRKLYEPGAKPLVTLVAASSGNHGGSTRSSLPHGSQLDTVMLGTRVHLGNVG